MLRSDERFDIRGGLINGTDEEKVPETVRWVRHAVVCTRGMNSLHVERGAQCRTLVAVSSRQGKALSSTQKATWREVRETDGMADSRSLMVRSGIMTSFCATTLVTPSFVSVFITTGQEASAKRA